MSFFECRVFDPNGNLKRVISAKSLTQRGLEKALEPRDRPSIIIKKSILLHRAKCLRDWDALQGFDTTAREGTFR